MTYFGEGATANGQCHEALNFAGIHRLPVVFVLENNRFAYSTPTELEFAVDPVEARGGLRLPGRLGGRQRRRGRLRGRARCRRPRPRRRRPTLIECHTMRMHGHGAHDDMSYVPKELLEEWEARDPIERYAERLVELHGFSTDEVEAIRDEVSRTSRSARGRRSSRRCPIPRRATEGVFAERLEPLGDGERPAGRPLEAREAA